MQNVIISNNYYISILILFMFGVRFVVLFVICIVCTLLFMHYVCEIYDYIYIYINK